MSTPLEQQLQSLNIAPDEIVEQGLSGQDVLESLARRLCRFLWPRANPDTTVIRSLGSGNYNTVLEIEINGWGKSATWRDSDLTRDLQYPRPHVDENALDENGMGTMALRIPRDANSEGLERTVAVLGYLKKQAAATFPVPKLICHDVTSNNPLGARYVIMSRIAGSPLREILEKGTLQQAQKLTLARELAQFYRQMQGVRSEVAGEIEAHPGRDLDDGAIMVRAFGSAGGAASRADDNNDNNNNNGESGAKVLVDAFERKLTNAKADANSPLRDFIPHLDMCLLLAKELLRTGLLTDADNKGGFSLCHTDLFPRNVMVDPPSSSSSTSPILTGVIDWDETIFAPRFATCQPPVWLWQSPGRQADEVEHFGAEWSAADSAENQEVKRAFEEAMGGGDYDYARLAYEPQFVIARRLLKFARAPTWLWRDWYVAQIQEMRREWEHILNRLQNDSDSGSAVTP